MSDTHLDFDRAARTGVPEVIFAETKTYGQIETIAGDLIARNGFVLATRVDPAHAERLLARFAGARFDARARCFAFGRLPATGGRVAVVCAGTSDLPVADEAAFTADALGNEVVRQTDVGVAGLHRLLADIDALAACDSVIVVAGMEGALPSVVAGLVAAPVIAVPTSIGYGAGVGGFAALLAMLTACAPGIGVVNIDNGFGAAALAHKIVLRARR